MVKFGTGGWRAIIGDEFTKANIQRLAKAMADKIKQEQVDSAGIVIGYDKRFLSKEGMHWMAEVMAKQGIKTYIIRKSVPTPVVMYYIMAHKLPYGMMVTASHNPAIYNGVKVFTKGGRDADEQQSREIEEHLEHNGKAKVEYLEYNKGIEAGLIEEIYPMNEYIDAVMKPIDMVAIRNHGLRVVIDPMYGVSETALKTLLMTARCEVKTIHGRHDTLFGGKLPSPSAKTLRTLQTEVVEGHYDIGIATDGDADRIGVIDDQGRFLHPNDILVLLYYYLIKYKHQQGDVVRNSCTTHMLDKIAKQFGFTCHEVPVGFKYISGKMTETGAIIGGESSGGLSVAGHINGKDGIYAAMLLIEMMTVTGKKVSQLYDEINEEYGQLYLVEKDYHFTKEKKEEVRSTLFDRQELPIFHVETDHVSYRDGCKVYFKNGGWISARFSGTEPLIRIFAEMPIEEQAQEVTRTLEDFLKIGGTDENR